MSGNKLMGQHAFSSRQKHLLLRPQQTNASSFFSSSMGYHANLSRHLPDQEPIMMTPSPLRRQNAFLQEDRSNMSNDKVNFSIPSSTTATHADDLVHSNVSSPMSSQLESEDPKCRICFGESEEGGAAFIVPCKCNGSIRYVHDLCLKDWMSSKTLPRRCSTCMEPFSFYPPTLQNPVRSRRRPILRTVLVIALTTFIMETYRCTELQKIPGSELDDQDTSTLGKPDYIWLPIVQHKCWRESLLATVLNYTFHSPIILCILTFILFYRISMSLKSTP
ncbi:hypothetical protein O0I10_005670 [Lichtheimia ornata]|uniref:RING-CH-type domain-containing protein n=1 Tax=Lichtheimia ornata TaxID=688661 RepID=A0AAD7V4F3_9FUNG|nr:uncharacterized protein O0I10_005670 [Lichtheimia ornata]KAJ8658630.1 hypothetical protein O0I10_005670 [Lichtheimia ornata]